MRERIYKLQKGDQVVMHGCYEAHKEKYKDKVWTVDLSLGTCVVRRLCSSKGTSEDLLQNI